MHNRFVSFFLISFVSIILFSVEVFAQYGIQTIGEDDVYYSYSLDKGESITDEVLVSNFSDEKITLIMNGVDVQIDSYGNFALNSPNNIQKEFGSWIDITEEIIELNPGQSKIIPFQLHLPEDIYSGQYAGGIVAGSIPVNDFKEGSMTMIFATQVGLRVYVDVKGEIIDKLAWDHLDFGDINGDNQYLEFSLANEGNSLLDVFTIITVNGEEVGVYPLGIITPGDSTTPQIAIAKPFIGVANVTAEVFYQRSMMFSDEELPVVSLGEGSLTKKYFPWKLASLVFSLWLLLVIIVVVLTVRERKFKKTLVKYKVKKADDIEILAKRYKVSWRRLARLNELKAPYHLNPGDVLLVPKKKK